jgi:ankyrin repeat protein
MNPYPHLTNPRTVYFLKMVLESPFLELLYLYTCCQSKDIEEILRVKNSINKPLDASMILPGKDESLLHAAVMSGNVEILKLLCSPNHQERIFSSDLNRKTPDGTTPLILASQNGQIDIIAFLLQQDSLDPNKADSKGMTPLHHAAHKDHAEAVKLLLSHSLVEPTLKDLNGNTPFDLAYDLYKSSESMSLLLDQSRIVNDLLEANPAKLFRAAHLSRNSSLLESILTHKISSIPDEELNRCLVLAAEMGFTRIFELLINLPLININAVEDGSSALHYACEQGLIELARLLLDKKADPNLKDGTLMTPLAFAAQSGYVEIVELLLSDPRTSLNISEANGFTPLHLACINLHIPIVKLLLADDTRTGDESLNLNAQSDLGFTPLMEAISAGNIELVQLLSMDPRWNRKIRDNAGRTPLHMASEYNKIEILNFLSAYYSFDATTSLGLTPFHIACKRGHLDLVKSFLESSKHSACIISYDKDGFSPLSSAWLHNYEEPSVYLIPEIWEMPYSELVPEQFSGRRALLKFLVKNFDLDLFSREKFSQNARIFLKDLFIYDKKESTNHTLLADYLCIELYLLSTLAKVYQRNSLLDQIHTLIAELSDRAPKDLLRDGISFILNSRSYEKSYKKERVQDPSISLQFTLTPSLAQTLLHHHIRLNNLHELSELLEAITTFKIPIDLQISDSKSNTLLEYACMERDVNLLGFLLNQPGIDPNILLRDDSNTPCYPLITLLCEIRNVSLVTRLLKYPSLDPNAKSLLENTALALAARSNAAEIVELLLSHPKVECNPLNSLRQTPLALSCSYGSLESLRLLLKDKRVNIDSKDIDGSTPLHLAAETGRLDCAIALLESGANFTEKNIFDYTPFHLACKMSQANIVEYLLKQGLFLSSEEDIDGFTPIWNTWLYNPSQIDSSLSFSDAFTQPYSLAEWEATLPKKRHTLCLLALKTTYPLTSPNFPSEGTDFLTSMLTLEQGEDPETLSLRNHMLDLLTETHSLALLAQNHALARSITSTIEQTLLNCSESLLNPKVTQILNPPHFTSRAQLEATFPQAITILDERALELLALLQFYQEGLLKFA